MPGPLPKIRQRLARWLAPELRTGYPEGAGPGYSSALAAPTLSGTPVDERTALGISAVWSAVSCYVNTIGALDYYVAERDERGGRRPAPEHPAYDLLRTKPNRESTAMRLRQAWVGHACTRGNGYIEIVWDARGRKPLELHLMDPRDVVPQRRNGEVYYRESSTGKELPAADVLHLAMFGFDGLKGYSPISLARETLGVAAAQRDYQAGLYGNSASAIGHLETPGTMNSADRTALREAWNKMHQGPANAGNIGILSGGLRWVQTNFSPADAEIIAGSRFSVEEAARIWNLPQHKLNSLEHATFSNVEEMNIDFYTSSILPWLTAIEQECDLKLLSRAERRVYFCFHDARSLLRGNVAAQTAQDKTDLETGIRSMNEVRVDRGLAPIADAAGDWHWVPTNNLSAVEMIPHHPPAPAPAGPPAGPATDPATAPPVSLSSLRAVLADPLARMVRRECNTLRRAARRGELETCWGALHGDDHLAAVGEAVAPALRVLAELTGRPISPMRFALRMAAETRARVEELADRTAPEGLAAAVESLCDSWESARADELASELYPGDDDGGTES